MAKANSSSEDTRKGRGRFVDQPGQWIDTTPKSVKAKQAKAWERLAKMLDDEKKQGKKK